MVEKENSSSDQRGGSVSSYKSDWECLPYVVMAVGMGAWMLSLAGRIIFDIYNDARFNNLRYADVRKSGFGPDYWSRRDLNVSCPRKMNKEVR